MLNTVFLKTVSFPNRIRILIKVQILHKKTYIRKSPVVEKSITQLSTHVYRKPADMFAAAALQQAYT